MRIRTQSKTGGWLSNHNEAIRVRSSLRGGGVRLSNHNEQERRVSHAIDIVTRDGDETAEGSSRHNEALQVRASLKAGGASLNHNEGLIVRTAMDTEGAHINHNQMLRVKPDRRVVSMGGPLCPRRRRGDLLELTVAQPFPRIGVVRRLDPGYSGF